MIALKFIAAGLIVIAILCIAACVQEAVIYRRNSRGQP